MAGLTDYQLRAIDYKRYYHGCFIRDNLNNNLVYSVKDWVKVKNKPDLAELYYVNDDATIDGILCDCYYIDPVKKTVTKLESLVVDAKNFQQKRYIGRYFIKDNDLHIFKFMNTDSYKKGIHTPDYQVVNISKGMRIGMGGVNSVLNYVLTPFSPGDIREGLKAVDKCQLEYVQIAEDKVVCNVDGFTHPVIMQLGKIVGYYDGGLKYVN